MKNILIIFIKFYQFFLSPMLGQSCRFYPSCSHYTIRALDEWGVIKGISMAIIRLLKCNPLFKGGIDEVPKNPKKSD